jgi:uncharacterized protein YbjT (DUF2867 family)
VTRYNVTRPDTLAGAVDGIDAIVFTLGSDGAGKLGAETVDYGGVRNVLGALGSRTVRIALMTSIGVTNRTGRYNRTTEAHDWKRRSERLVRASGSPYTIVRPGWFDCTGPDEHRLVLLQGDTRQAGDSSDGVIARRQIAEVLVHSLASDQAVQKTFELVATKGEAQTDFDALVAALAAVKARWTACGTRIICGRPTSPGRSEMIWTLCSRVGPRCDWRI